jgi:hypothetical protein
MGKGLGLVLNLFKQCTLCAKNWVTREEFLADPHIRISGFQAGLQDVKEGFFLFSHSALGCDTTLSLPVGLFLDMLENPAPIPDGNISYGRGACEGHCKHPGSFETCQAACANAHCRLVARRLRDKDLEKLV